MSDSECVILKLQKCAKMGKNLCYFFMDNNMNKSTFNGIDFNLINNYKAYIITLADKHHVVYRLTEMDTLAEKFTELSGDTVVQDDICDLLVALTR